MKTTVRHYVRGFTLIELLVVIGIIAILAGLLIPAVMRAKVNAQIQTARLQMAQIVGAIREYESAYNQLPISTQAQQAALAASSDDFTYGTGTSNPSPIKGPTGNPLPILSSGTYQANNSEVMACLMDMDTFPNGVVSVNQAHLKNPQKNKFLNANSASDVNSGGVGPDGVYRDPWGSPFIISFDVNRDDKVRDAFYKNQAVSEDPNSTTNPKSSLNGLIRSTVNGVTVFEANAPVIVWSAGPDKSVDPGKPANFGVNKDNILSWK